MYKDQIRNTVKSARKQLSPSVKFKYIEKHQKKIAEKIS